jgi:2-oxoisovalerate dehydrogenase E1 component
LTRRNRSPSIPTILSAIKELKTKFSQAKVKEILSDYRLAVESREASLIGRKEVFMGKAKFGIFGDGKEVAQIAMAKVFAKAIFVLVITVIKHLCLPLVS